MKTCPASNDDRSLRPTGLRLRGGLAAPFADGGVPSPSSAGDVIFTSTARASLLETAVVPLPLPVAAAQVYGDATKFRENFRTVQNLN